MQIILTHINADFDAVASLLGAYKRYPSATPILPKRLNRNVEEFILRYTHDLPFVAWDEINWDDIDSIDQLILVDTQRIPDLTSISETTQIYIIDHHAPKDTLPDNVTFSGKLLGAITTLLVEHIREQNISLTPIEATLLALGIYEDTGSLTYGATTPRDIQAVAWLLEQQADLEIIRQFLNKPLNDKQQALFDKLLPDIETRTIHGHTISVAMAKVDHYVEQINSVTHHLSNLLDPSALFVLVEMPSSLQIVCRAKGGVLNAGEIARQFGGGGHSRAAAAHIKDGKYADILTRLWALIHTHTQAETTIADLMSYGVQTVAPSDKLVDISTRLRRIGHEGYPVLDNNQVVGLLTRRDIDRALEHQLNETTVSDVMQIGAIALHPTASVTQLEHLIVDSGWGQIPIVDDHHSLIGIVTRTDLIKHWASIHPEIAPTTLNIGIPTFRTVLGDAITELIQSIAHIAQNSDTSIYLVGGIVRDLFLERPNYDIDFVVEGDAIAFGERVQGQCGGTVTSYRPFGTAKWLLDASVAQNLGFSLELLPDHIDFASSRNEFYDQPTALPTVYSGSIKLDLSRRDFTINTLAIQLSPTSLTGRVLDYYNGLADLHNQQIRVLHSMSFVDDPTRILRAVRFEQRLGFTIEPRTAELITIALPMLQRITGERLRNELHLLLKEARPENGLTQLQQRGVLKAIHPAFTLSDDLKSQFDNLRSWYTENQTEADIPDLLWHIVMAQIPYLDIPDVCERLLFSKSFTQSLQDTAQLLQNPQNLTDSSTLPSVAYKQLKGIAESALIIVTLISTDDALREHIRYYREKSQHIKLTIDGNVLKQRGLPAGAEYRLILDKLRSAYIDGKIQSPDEEYELLERLIREVYHDDLPPNQ